MHFNLIYAIRIHINNLVTKILFKKNIFYVTAVQPKNKYFISYLKQLDIFVIYVCFYNSCP